MRRDQLIISTVLVLVCFGVFDLDAQTQSDLDEQACGQFHKADVAMNETYSRVLKEYTKDDQFVAKLKTAQAAWLAFRDAQVEALFPKTDKQAAYGTVYPMCHCNALQTLTDERTKQLKVWLQGFPEGDVCSGSVKVTQRFRPLAPATGGARQIACAYHK